MFHNRLLDPSKKQRETSNHNTFWRQYCDLGITNALPTSSALERSVNALIDRREKSQEKKLRNVRE